MRLARYRAADGRAWVGRVEGDSVVPAGPDGPGVLVDLAMAGEAAVPAAGPPVALAGVRLLAPVPRPPSVRDFYAFEQHVAAARKGRGLDMDPDWYRLPVFYFSNPHVVLGPDDEVAVPGTERLDYELELAAVVGRDGSGLSPEEAAGAVAGYTVMNDWSARDLQAREMRLGLGPAKGKDFATSLGPWLVTPDELPGGDAGRPRGAMVARVNGEEWSRGELGDLHFGFGDLVAFAARDSRVRAGDVIGSGTVGTGCILELRLTHGPERYRWLRPGDVVELEVEGIGVLRNPIRRPL